MTENLIIISLVGLLAGFVFSMPVAGPTSIVITSNALKGRTRYCNLVSIGASFADLVYVFIIVFGLTKFYSLYKPFIPYVLLAGALFVAYTGYNISKTKIDLEHIPDDTEQLKKIKAKSGNGFWTGILLGFLNPTLFLGWIASSFIVFSLLASLGFKTGDLDKNIQNNLNLIHKNTGIGSSAHRTVPVLQNASPPEQNTMNEEEEEFPKNYTLLLSCFYAFFVALGSIIWFYFLSRVIAKFRHRISTNKVQFTIRVLGFALYFVGAILAYKGISMFR